MANPKFSIIVPFHYSATKVDVFVRGLTTLRTQTYKDFEVKVIHDGPFDVPNIQNKARYEYAVKQFGKMHCMGRRYNDFGHSLRDYGMKNCEGEWIIHFNPDNVLYPFAISKLIETMDIYKEAYGVEPDFIIPPIYMMGCIRRGRALIRHRGEEQKYKMLLQGFPPVITNIDAMQLVAKKSLWEKIGYWKDKSEQSDGYYAGELYEFCDGNVGYVNKAIGEHY